VRVHGRLRSDSTAAMPAAVAQGIGVVVAATLVHPRACAAGRGGRCWQQQPAVERSMKGACWTIARGLAVALAVVLMGLAAAQADRVWPPPKPRFPQQHITAEQVQAQLEKMKADPTAGVLANSPHFPDTVIVFVGGEWQGIYHFTKPESPAHPAMVFERIESDRKHSYLNLEGYFAGSPEAFATWFAAIEKFTRDTADSDTIVTIQQWN
jgi:hypothetical protein